MIGKFNCRRLIMFGKNLQTLLIIFYYMNTLIIALNLSCCFQSQILFFITRNIHTVASALWILSMELLQPLEKKTNKSRVPLCIKIHFLTKSRQDRDIRLVLYYIRNLTSFASCLFQLKSKTTANKKLRTTTAIASAKNNSCFYEFAVVVYT